MNTLLLDQATWDLVADASGNIAVASAPYSIAQDVATACRLFKGELWFDKERGIPYFEQVLGVAPSPEIVREYLRQQALSVTGVVAANVVITGYTDRSITGQIQVTDNQGAVQYVNF